MKSTTQISCLLLLTVISLIAASPKKYSSDEGNFQPSSLNRYYESNLPSTRNNTNAEPKVSKESRFGLPVSTYGNTGNGVQYGGGGVGYSVSPMKIDIGGIVLGALIGLGAVLILPKLANIFSGGYGYRSLETDMSAVTNILARIDNSLEQHSIDSSSCMQRVICTYVNEARKNMEMGEANTVDQFVSSLSENSLVTYVLDGTAVKQAIEMGKQGDIDKCATLSSKCPLDKEKIIQVIASLLPA